MKCGLLAKKVGMSSFERDGKILPVTLLSVESCQIVDFKTDEKHGYSAAVIAYGQSLKNVAKPQKQWFLGKNLDIKSSLKEFRVSSTKNLSLGQILDAKEVRELQRVDITGRSSGKGFAGGMKRHNFSGLRASHGVSISHRSSGSIGQCQDPGRVFKGKKMAGHMGCDMVTIKNLLVVFIDCEVQMIGILGAVPGKPGEMVVIRDAWKEKDQNAK